MPQTTNTNHKNKTNLNFIFY